MADLSQDFTPLTPLAPSPWDSFPATMGDMRRIQENFFEPLPKTSVMRPLPPLPALMPEQLRPSNQLSRSLSPISFEDFALFPWNLSPCTISFVQVFLSQKNATAMACLRIFILKNLIYIYLHAQYSNNFLFFFIQSLVRFHTRKKKWRAFCSKKRSRTVGRSKNFHGNHFCVTWGVAGCHLLHSDILVTQCVFCGVAKHDLLLDQKHQESQ